MIVIKHSKVGNIAFVSHVDCMRVLQRSLGRAGIKTLRSTGFNPHPTTYCSHPLPVGIASTAEYLTYAEAENRSLEDIKNAFNLASPGGIQALEVFSTAVNPNIAGRVVSCDYEVVHNLDELAQDRVRAYFAMENKLMNTDRKGEPITLEVNPLVHAYRVEPTKIYMRLATGKPTLRPDKFIFELNRACELQGQELNITDTVRTAHYIDDKGVIKNADEYCKELSGLAAGKNIVSSEMIIGGEDELSGAEL